MYIHLKNSSEDVSGAQSSMKNLKAGSTLSLESMCQKVLFSKLSNPFIGFSANNVSAFSKCLW